MLQVYAFGKVRKAEKPARKASRKTSKKTQPKSLSDILVSYGSPQDKSCLRAGI
jgi:hypothetical protein